LREGGRSGQGAWLCKKTPWRSAPRTLARLHQLMHCPLRGRLRVASPSAGRHQGRRTCPWPSRPPTISAWSQQPARSSRAQARPRERYLLTMMQVEKSHVPFPTNRLCNSAGGLWNAMSKIRKEKYESSGLTTTIRHPGQDQETQDSTTMRTQSSPSQESPIGGSRILPDRSILVLEFLILQGDGIVVVRRRTRTSPYGSGHGVPDAPAGIAQAVRREGTWDFPPASW